MRPPTGNCDLSVFFLRGRGDGVTASKQGGGTAGVTSVAKRLGAYRAQRAGPLLFPCACTLLRKAREGGA